MNDISLPTFASRQGHENIQFKLLKVKYFYIKKVSFLLKIFDLTDFEILINQGNCVLDVHGRSKRKLSEHGQKKDCKWQTKNCYM